MNPTETAETETTIFVTTIGAEENFYTAVLDHALVSSIRHVTTSDGPLEEITFDYLMLTETYTDGGVTATVP